MHKLWHSAKGWLMATTAFIACPCHLPITLPLLIGLLGGTAIGAWISDNTAWVYGFLTVYFLGAGLLAFRWLTRRERPAIERSRQKADVILLTTRNCNACDKADQLWQELGANREFVYRRVDLGSGNGRSLAAEHNITSTPTTLIDGQVAFREVPNRLQAARSVR